MALLDQPVTATMTAAVDHEIADLAHRLEPADELAQALPRERSAASTPRRGGLMT